MKTFKLLVPALVFVIAVMGSAFTVKKEKTHENTTDTMSLYWYKVSYDQNGNPYIANSGDFVTQDEKQNVDSPCLEGDNLDCLRGFATAITSFPSSPDPVDHIQKP